MANILNNSVNYLPHVAMWDELFQKRFGDFPIGAGLVYLIDTVDASALPLLAEQFGVAGFAGYRLATTEQEKRNLIKRGIELHRYRGTLWAIKQAISSIGFGDAVIEEHVDGHWAKFRVYIDIASRVVSDQDVANLKELILYWKNERSQLVDIAYQVLIGESFTILADCGFSQTYNDGDAMSVGGVFLYDGTYAYDGTKNYSSDSDILELQIQ